MKHILGIHVVEGICSIILRVVCGGGAQPSLVDTDPFMGVVSLVSAVRLPLLTSRDKETF